MRSLYLDEDMSQRVADLLRRRGVDATSSHEVGNDGLDDESQLAYATGEGRHLVTYNRLDFITLADRWYRARRSFPTIILMPPSTPPRADVGAVAEALVRLCDSGRLETNPDSCVLYA